MKTIKRLGYKVAMVTLAAVLLVGIPILLLGWLLVAIPLMGIYILALGLTEDK